MAITSIVSNRYSKGISHWLGGIRFYFGDIVGNFMQFVS
jgi:hypothetical protein